MNPKRNNLSHVRFAGKAAPPAPEKRLQGGKLTAGVPLPKLIKRRMSASPELVMLADTHSVGAEKFRRLKTMLVNGEEGDPQVIVVTSAAPAEGKSLIAANLALAFANDRQGDVLLIDADLRRPTVEHWLKPAPKLGASELLSGQTELDHVLLELENSPLHIIPAGEPPRDPVELLAADYTGAVIETLRQRYRRIIIDTPPIVPFTDADAVGRFADGSIVVARSGATRRAMMFQALGSVTSTRLLGIVLNDVTYNLADRENYHGDKSYRRYYDKERRK